MLTLAKKDPFGFKLTKNRLGFLIAAITLIGAYIAAILPFYLNAPPTVIQATVGLITGIVNAAIVALTVEEQKAPE